MNRCMTYSTATVKWGTDAFLVFIIYYVVYCVHIISETDAMFRIF